MNVENLIETPEWVATIAAEQPDADLWVSFRHAPAVFSRVLRTATVHDEDVVVYPPECRLPLRDVAAYHVGPAGEVVEIPAPPEPESTEKE